MEAHTQQCYKGLSIYRGGYVLSPGLLKTHNTECIPASFLLWLVTQIDIEENFGGGLLMCPAVLFLALIQTLGQSFSFFYFNQDRFCSL
jgi:hypothetical protein